MSEIEERPGYVGINVVGVDHPLYFPESMTRDQIAAAIHDHPAIKANKANYFSDFDGMEHDVMKGLINREFIPSDEISTITGKPIMKSNPDFKHSNAGLWTSIKQGFVDDPETKMKMYADARFPNLQPKERYSKYGIVDGEIVYVGDDGKLYPEHNPNITGALKKMAASTVADGPGMVLSGIGASAGGGTGPLAPLVSPALAALGAAGGEGYRKAVGSLVFDEPQTTGENIVDMGFQAGSALAGEAMGKGINALRQARNFKKNPFIKYAGDTSRLSETKIVEAAAAKKAAEKYGVNLLPHQAYNDQSMVNVWDYLRRHPETAGAVEKIEKHMADNAETSFLDFMDRDSLKTGESLVDAANDAVTFAERKRTEAVTPFYEKFRKEGRKVDISGVIDYIDSFLTSSKDVSQRQLLRVKRMLQKKEGSGPNMMEFFKKHGEERGLSKEYMEGYLKKYGKYGPEENFMALDEAKNVIDFMLSGPDSASIEKGTRAKLIQIKNKLLSTMHKVDPDYKKARSIYEQMSPDIEELKNSVLGKIRGLKGDQAVKAIEMVFSKENLRNPVIILKARHYLKTHAPEVWDDVVPNYLSQQFKKGRAFNKTPFDTIKTIEYNLYGTPDLSKFTRAITTPEQYETIKGFLDALKRSGIGYGGVASKGGGQVVKGAGESVINAAEMLSNPHSAVFKMGKEAARDKWDDIMLNGRQKELLETLLQNDAVNKIGLLKRLSPESKRFWDILSTVMTVKKGSDLKRNN
jgi:hypothetical protein